MELNQFLESSPLAEKIKLESRVVIHRTQLSHEELLAIRRQGSLGPVKKQDTTCELVISGQVLAWGKIVKQGDGYYFKVTKMNAKQEVQNGK